MATIKSGNSTDLQTVDPVSKAGRVTLYDVSGVAVTQFWQNTQPISASSLPLPIGASTEATLALIKAKTDNLDVLLSTRLKPADTLTAIGSITNVVHVDDNGAALTVDIPVGNMPSAAFAVSANAAVSLGVTCTLPAVAGMFHYITLIEITKMNGLAITASGTPAFISSTNLPGPLAWTIGNGEGGVTIGASSRIVHMPSMPLKSSVANTTTTIVCPATTGIIWRVTVWYQIGI
jgi:hypothetical protein